jgi:xanthine/CO dehydrogenase XdhC/CoxF family maturation factor
VDIKRKSHREEGATMTSYTFETSITVVESTTVEAETQEEAEEMVRNGECDWEEIKAEGDELEFIG